MREGLLSLKYEKRMRSEIADKTYLTKGWGYVAAIALLSYAILKSLWAWGSTVLDLQQNRLYKV